MNACHLTRIVFGSQSVSIDPFAKPFHRVQKNRKPSVPPAVEMRIVRSRIPFSVFQPQIVGECSVSTAFQVSNADEPC